MIKAEKKGILIVDDDEKIRKTYAEMFREQGLQVIEAKDGVEGLDIATSEEGIDVIFTGIIMPRMDGFQLISSLKEYSSTSEIPVVVNSHLGREEDRKKMIDLGVKDFIVQGITMPIDVVKRVIQAMGIGEYIVAIDKNKFDGIKFAEEQKFPVDYKCKKCENDLALKLKYFREGTFKAVIVCPTCEGK